MHRNTHRPLRLVACLLNISEARNKHIVESVALSAVRHPTTHGSGVQCPATGVQCPATVLNVFSDQEYNRSVITIAAPLENIEESVYTACVDAYKKIDLAQHSGGHPRLGSVDLVPIHPIHPDVSLEECGHIATRIGHRIVDHIKGTSVFFFGHADVPQNRGLVERRKAVHWYEGKSGMDFGHIGWDLGPPPSPQYGCTGVGAIPYITNCNITIKTKNLNLGMEIAKCIRATTPGGLQGVQAMAFGHKGMVEIACNVQCAKELSNDCQFQYTSAEEIEKTIKHLAEQQGVEVFGSTLVGLTPEDCYDRAEQALLKGNTTAWRSMENNLGM